MRINGAQTAAIESIWYSGDFTGDQMPTARCTIHKGNVRLTNGGGYGDFASIIFSVGAERINGIYTYYPRELPAVKSVSWNRDTGTSVATATIVLYNTQWNPSTGELEPGYFTWNRGTDSFSKARGIAKNAWYGMLVPDNIIRTYEGYGADYSVGPEQDSHLIGTGNWIIDKVEFKGGLITLTCSDLGRILIDQIFFPPITPRSSPIPGIQYPVQFSSYVSVPYPQSEKYTPLFMAFDDSSSTPYTGPNGYQAGHYAYQCCDGNSDTFWLSIGNGAPNADFSYEWVQARIGGETIGAVNVHALYANLQGYVSVYQEGFGWMGSDTIPYNPDDPVSSPNGANIPYVARFTSTGNNQLVEFPLIVKAIKIRITFTNLQDSGIGPYVYRAGVREFDAMAAKTLPAGTKITKDAGFNYTDYTDLIKLFCVWGGFHWPKPSDQPFIAVSKAPGFPDGVAFELFAKPPNDKYLKNGRVWGDLEDTGTYGVVPLTIDQFDKKTLMDGITLIQQTVNFLFMIDESGGVVWRFPNYKQRGNRIEGTGQRIQRFIRILDTQTLQDIGVTLDGSNARERNYVGSPDGQFVGGARGYNLNPIGLRRVLGYIDKNFGSNKECQTMANFISIAQMMSYRTLDLVIAGLPTMQIDDQTEVVDTATGEGYLHYVKSIVSSLDMSQGTYTYELTTSWLGARAGTEWAFDKYGNLSADLTYLLDTYDKARQDGAYNGFAPVTIPVQVDVADITTSPASPVGPGVNVTLTAIISPNIASGHVQFIRDGVRALGSPRPVDTSTGHATLTINSNVIGSGSRLGAFYIPTPHTSYNAASTDIPFEVT